MKKCKECGREEWGFLSALNKDGYCPRCAIVHYEEKIKKLQEQLNEANRLILWCARISWTGNQEEDDFDRYLAKWGVK